MFDVVEALDDGFGRSRRSAPRAEIPLQITDPEDEIGDGGSAGIQFDSLQLVRIDGEAGFVQSLLAFPEAFERIVDLGFEALEMFKSHVQEVAGAARRIEDLDGAEALPEISEHRDGVSWSCRRAPG